MSTEPTRTRPPDPATHSSPAATRPPHQGLEATVSQSPEDSARSASASTSGVSVPGYEVLDELGRGAMGIVYRARDLRLNRIAAVKMILGGIFAERRLRFLAEAEAAAAVRHPHVVQVYEFGEADGHPFLALEYLPGGTLATRTGSPLPPRDAARLLAKVARGVGAAHEAGIVHRDLKPGNVLFDADGEPKVTDFGLAKRVVTDLTATEAVMGTPAYMAPEQARGEAKFVGPQADVYALGVILYECLTGSRPFESRDHIVLLRMVAEVDPDRPSKRVRGLPRDAELICLKCMAKDPAERYPTAGELADDLERFVADRPIRARPQSGVERARRLVRRYPLTSALAGTLAVVTVVALVVTSVLYARAVQARNAADASATLAAKNEARATENAARADQKADLAERTVREMLLALGNKLSDTTDVPRVRLEMYEKALNLYRQMAAEPGGDTLALRRQLAETHDRVARLRGNLNQDAAEEDHMEAIRLYRGLAESPDADPADARSLLTAAESYALFLRERGRHKEAVLLFEDVARRLAKSAASRPEDQDLQADSIRVEGTLGLALADAGDPDRGSVVFREALGRSDSILAAHTDWGHFRYEDAKLRVKYADLLLRTLRRPAEAAPLYEAALRELERVKEANADRVSAASNITGCIANYSVCLVELKRHREGEELRERAIEIWTRLAAQFPDLPDYRCGRAVALANTASSSQPPARIEARLREAVTDLNALVDDHPNTPEYRQQLAMATSNLAVFLLLQSRPADALRLFEQARKHTYTLLPNGPTTDEAKQTFFRQRKGHGFALWMSDRFDEAAEAFAEAAKFGTVPGEWDEATGLELCMRVRAGKADAAIREVERLLGEGKFKGQQAIHAASVFGEAYSAATGDPERKEAHAKRAIELAGRAVEAGYGEPGQLRSLSGFRDLQARAEFRQLVLRAAANAGAKSPPGK